MKAVTNIQETITYDRLKLKIPIKIGHQALSEILTYGEYGHKNLTITTNSFGAVINDGNSKTYVPFENVILLEKKNS